MRSRTALSHGAGGQLSLVLVLLAAERRDLVLQDLIERLGVTTVLLGKHETAFA